MYYLLYVCSSLLILFDVTGAMVVGVGKQCPGTFNCTQGGHVFCNPPPCPAPGPCKDPVTKPGECCAYCPESDESRMNCIPPPPCPPPPCEDYFIPADRCCPVCPDQCSKICNFDGKKYCNEQPVCHVMPCPFTVLTPGDCCPHCEG